MIEMSRPGNPTAEGQCQIGVICIMQIKNGLKGLQNLYPENPTAEGQMWSGVSETGWELVQENLICKMIAHCKLGPTAEGS